MSWKYLHGLLSNRLFLLALKYSQLASLEMWLWKIMYIPVTADFCLEK